MIRWFVFCFCLIFSAFPAAAERPATVFAAASLSTVLTDIVHAWGGAASVSYGGSGLLARQVALAAPADLVLLANPIWMDWLEQRGAVLPATRKDLLANRLVVIAPAGAKRLDALTPDVVNRLLAGGRFAIGQTDSVPGGQYAKAYLQNAGLWLGLKDRLAETENVRVALSYVARREAPLGIVYATDAIAEQRVVSIFDIPKSRHPPIWYPLALTPMASQNAKDFWIFLQSTTAAAIFAMHGFETLETVN
jgi:molybdate transport system substrate-binding protein